MTPKAVVSAFLVAAALALAACGGSDDAGLSVDGAWARTSPASASAGAAYFEITSGEGDVLIGASVDSSIAGRVEIHETAMVPAEEAMQDGSMGDEHENDMDDMDDMDEGEVPMGDVMQMRELESLDLPAGETVVLEPGGTHIMLLDLAAPLEEGQEFELTLDFETQPDETITVVVGSEAPSE